jgi:hypothetical protein
MEPESVAASELTSRDCDSEAKRARLGRRFSAMKRRKSDATIASRAMTMTLDI